MINNHTIIENYCDMPRNNFDRFEDIPLSDSNIRLSYLIEAESYSCFSFNLFRLVYDFMFPYYYLKTT